MELVGMKFNMPVFNIKTGEFDLTETKVTGWCDGSDLTGDILTIEQNGESKDVVSEKFINSIIKACEMFGEKEVIL